MQDIRASSALERNLDHPLAPFLYAVSVMHRMTVSLAQGGAGLGTMSTGSAPSDVSGISGLSVIAPIAPRGPLTCARPRAQPVG